MSWTPCLLWGQFPFDPDTVQFEKIAHRELNGALINNMYFDTRGILWVATHQGLFSFDGYDWKSGMSRPPAPDQDVDQWIQNTVEDTTGQIWFGTETGGLYRLDPATRKIKSLPPADHTGEVLHNLIGHELSFHHQDLIVQTHLGYLRFNPYTGQYTETFIPYPDLDDQEVLGFPGAHPLNDIHHFLADGQTIWLGTAGGLIQYNSAKNELRQCPWPFTNPALGLNESISVMDIHESGDSLLIGTYGAGLITYRKDLSAWNVHLPEPMDREHEGGVWSNVIQHVEAVDKSRFLFAGSPGCGVFNWATGDIDFFQIPSVADEMYRKILIDHNGRIWTCSNTAIYRSVHPVFPAKNNSQLLLTLVSIPEGEKYTGYLTTIDSMVRLHEYQHTIEFAFALTQPLHADSVKYAYQLIGFDRNWVESGNRRHARYAQLRGGKYTFRIKATTSTGKVVHADMMEFSIHTPFYKTGWFIGMCALAFLSAVYYIYRVNVDKARLKERLQAGFQTEIARMEMQSLRSQMNPHFIFNSLNSIKNYIISKGQAEAADYVTKFAKLVRVILDHSRSDLLTLEQEIHALKLYVEMENMRFEKEFHYTLSVDPGIDQQSFLLPPMLIQPYVENAIWHGLMHKPNDRQLDIRFTQHGDSIRCTVEDNGIGRNKAATLAQTRKHRRESYGTKITAHRIDMIKKLYATHVEVVVTDKDPQDDQYPGTSVQITIQRIHQLHDTSESHSD